MTPDRIRQEMQMLGLTTAGLDGQGRPCALIGPDLAVVESAHRIGGFPHVDMPEPLQLGIYPPAGASWAGQPRDSWAGLSARQVLAQLAEFT